jgi:ankyrin repeat protein
LACLLNAGNKNNDAEVTALLTDARVDVNALDDFGLTPFMMASGEGNYSVVVRLLGCERVEVNAAKKDNGDNALLMAVEESHESIVAQLVDCRRVDVNSADYRLLNALTIAATKGNESIVCILINCDRLDVNSADMLKQTALIIAAYDGFEAIACKLIECERVDVNAASLNKQTAIYMAASCGHVSIVAKLIECDRVDLDAPDEIFFSPIMMAANKGFDAVVDMLAEAGAILSSDHSQYSLHGMISVGKASLEQKASVHVVLKKHGVINDNVPSNFQSKYYFEDGEGEIYIRNVKYQRWLNRRTLLLALYRTYKWSLDNQVLTDARRTLPPDLSGVGKFICQCWFDVAGGGKYESETSDTLGNGIGRLIMQFYGGFDTSKNHFALRGKPEYGKLPDNAARCSNCIEKMECKALNFCASCGVVRYCSKVCQKADWKRHKRNCKIWAEEKKKGRGEKTKKN